MLIMITNTIAPYCYDIAHVLGLPTYLSHRFRYRANRVKLTCTIEHIIGKETLIVLRNFDTGDFFPIRYAEIEDVLKVGDINYIEFCLESYFPIAQMESVSQQIAAALGKKGFENKGGKDLDCLLFEIGGGKLGEARSKIKEREHEKWWDILRVIGDLECYKEFSFLKILHVRDSDGNSSMVTRDETGKHSFLLKPGCVYWLDVIQYIPWQIKKRESIESPYDVELKTETDQVTVLRKVQRVVGKYDLLRFIFKTPKGYAFKHTFLEVENKQRGELSKYGLPALFLPLRIQPPTWMKWILRIRFVLGALAAVAMIGSRPLARALNVGPDWIWIIALSILVLVSGKWDDFLVSLIRGAKEAKLS